MPRLLGRYGMVEDAGRKEYAARPRDLCAALVDVPRGRALQETERRRRVNEAWDGRIQADARLLPLASESVQLVVTSPPYWGLRDYGVDGQIGLERTPEEYVATMVDVFREVGRVLRPDGTVWVNVGDSYSGAPRSNNGFNERWHGKEFLSDKQGDTDKMCPRRAISLKPKDLVGIPWRVAFALQAAGWYLRCDVIWAKPNPMPESVTDRPTRAHEYIFLLAKSERYFYDAEAIKEVAVWPRGPNSPQSIASPYGQGFTRRAQVGAKRKDLRSDRESRHRTAIEGGQSLEAAPSGFRNKRSVWTVATAPYPEAHYATFPPDLIEPCILAGSRPGDMVLDPFFGSGTVGRVAEQYSRRWIGVDLGFQDLQAKRLANLQKELIL